MCVFQICRAKCTKLQVLFTANDRFVFCRFQFRYTTQQAIRRLSFGPVAVIFTKKPKCSIADLAAISDGAFHLSYRIHTLCRLQYPPVILGNSSFSSSSSASSISSGSVSTSITSVLSGASVGPSGVTGVVSCTAG